MSLFSGLIGVFQMSPLLSEDLLCINFTQSQDNLWLGLHKAKASCGKFSASALNLQGRIACVAYSNVTYHSRVWKLPIPPKIERYLNKF